jgi:hypothetical protein
MRMAVALGMLLAVLVVLVTGAVVYFAGQLVEQREELRKTERDRVRTDAEVARIAEAVFRRNEKRSARAERLGNTAIEVLLICERNRRCVTIGRRVFGPSRARLLAHARKAVEDYCAARGGCRGRDGRHASVVRLTRVVNRPVPGPRGPAGPRGRPGPQGPPGPAGLPGADVGSVLAELCAGAPRLLRPLACR